MCGWTWSEMIDGSGLKMQNQVSEISNKLKKIGERLKQNRTERERKGESHYLTDKNRDVVAMRASLNYKFVRYLPIYGSLRILRHSNR